MTLDPHHPGIVTETPTVTRASRTPRRRAARSWLIPTGLITLSLVPVLAGAMRLTDLTVGAEATPATARFFDSPVPIVVHIVGATVYLLLGAFQFVPRLRQGRGRPSWHRIAGRVLVPAGLIAAVSGIWMGAFYPRPEYDMVARILFGSLMAVFIVLGVRSVVRRDFRRHRAWMIRGYAIGIGAGTQVLTALAWFVLSAHAVADPPTACALLVAGWVINLAVAEVVIRRSIA